SKNEFDLWRQDFHRANLAAGKKSKEQQALNAIHGETVYETYERTKREAKEGQLDYQALMIPKEVVMLLKQIDLELGRINKATAVIRGPFVAVSEPTLDSVK